MVKTKLEKIKKLYVDKKGLGRLVLDKTMLDMLEWKNRDTIEMVCDLETEEITIRPVSLYQKKR